MRADSKPRLFAEANAARTREFRSGTGKESGTIPVFMNSLFVFLKKFSPIGLG
jgi:hypothetical protein